MKVTIQKEIDMDIKFPVYREKYSGVSKETWKINSETEALKVCSDGSILVYNYLDGINLSSVLSGKEITPYQFEQELHRAIGIIFNKKYGDK